HVVAWLDALRVRDPCGEISTVVVQSSGRQRCAAGNMCKIRPGDTGSVGATDCVAEWAGGCHKGIPPLGCSAARGSVCGLQLSGAPAVKVLLGLDKDIYSHVSVLRAAKFRALTPEYAGAGRSQMDVGLPAWNQVLFAMQVRYPETVDDIRRAQGDRDRHIDR